jgi:hypothetical protein
MNVKESESDTSVNSLTWFGVSKAEVEGFFGGLEPLVAPRDQDVSDGDPGCR